MKTAYRAGKKGEGDISSLYDTVFTSRDEHVFHLKAKIGENKSKLLELSKEREALQKDFTENFLETNKDDLTVTGLTDAFSYRQTKKIDYLIYALFFAEFLYGFWAMKNILGDSSFSNTLVAFVTGGAVVLISLFLKKFPERFKDNAFSYIYSLFALISASLFIYCLATERSGGTESYTSLESFKTASESMSSSDILFSASLLLTLLFTSAALHVIAHHPRRLADSRRYLSAYAPILSKDAEIKTTNLEIRKDESHLEQIQNFTDKSLKNLIYQSYYEGLTSLFPTQKKRDVLTKLLKQKQTSVCGA